MSSIGEIIQQALGAVFGQINHPHTTTTTFNENDIDNILKPVVCENTECSICLDSFNRNNEDNLVFFPRDETATSELTVGEDHTPVELPCGHIFGSSCLKEWLHKSPQCPLCRRKFDANKVMFDHKLDMTLVPQSWVSKPTEDADFFMPIKSMGVSFGNPRLSNES